MWPRLTANTAHVEAHALSDSFRQLGSELPHLPLDLIMRTAAIRTQLKDLGKAALVVWAVCSVAACGGGGTEIAPPLPRVQLVGEVLGQPAQVASSTLKASAGYSGNLDTARAIQRAGQAPLLDMLFMLPPASAATGTPYALYPDAEQKLITYVQANADLLQAGVRVLIHDEVYWNPQGSADTADVLQPQLDALAQAVALVRRYAPQVSVGITVTPYSSLGRPLTLQYIKRAIAQVDWVGTDPYWFGDANGIADLNEWTRIFPAMAKAANPTVETWLIAQAFRDPSWDVHAFNRLMAAQLAQAPQYDNLIFFGWQFVSELPANYAGLYFTEETRRIYAAYLKP